ncbi:MAG: FTR1 family protein [Thermoleophilia bacterium]
MGAGLILLREGFEASLVVVIVLSLLNRIGRRDVLSTVWIAVAAAMAVSVAIGGVLVFVGAEFDGRAEKIWEGTTMLAAAGLLTWMIFWMRRQARSLRGEIEGQVRRALATGSSMALGTVVFVGVLREGLETALFVFGSFQGANRLTSTVGATVGLTVAVALGYLVYRGGSRLPLARFFSVTSGLLLVFAAYLLASALGELSEGGLFPEGNLMRLVGFAALAVPTLYFFFRPQRQGLPA